MKNIFAKISILMLIIVLGVMLSSCSVLDVLLDTSGLQLSSGSQGDVGDGQVDADAEFNKAFFDELNSFNSSIQSEAVRIPEDSFINSGFTYGLQLEITDYTENDIAIEGKKTILKDNVLYIIEEEQVKIVKLYNEGSAMVTTSNYGTILESAITANHSLAEILNYALVKQSYLSEAGGGKFKIDNDYINDLFMLINTYVENEVFLDTSNNVDFVLDATEYDLKDILTVYSDYSMYKITLDKSSFINGTGTLVVSIYKNNSDVARISVTTKGWLANELIIKANCDGKVVTVLRQDKLFKKEIVNKDDTKEYSLSLAENDNTIAFSFESANGTHYYSGMKVVAVATLQGDISEGEDKVYTISTEITKDGVTTGTSATMSNKSETVYEMSLEQKNAFALADNFYTEFKTVNANILKLANNGYKKIIAKLTEFAKNELPKNYYYVDSEKGIAYFVDYDYDGRRLTYNVAPVFDYQNELYFRSKTDLSFTELVESQLMQDAKAIYDSAVALIKAEMDGFGYKEQTNLYVYNLNEDEGLYVIVNMAAPSQITYTDNIEGYEVENGYLHSLSETGIHSFTSQGKDSKCCELKKCDGCQTVIIANEPTHTFTTEVLRDSDEASLSTCDACKYMEINVGDNYKIVIAEITDAVATQLDISDKTGYYSINEIIVKTVSDAMVLDIPALKTGKIVAVSKGRLAPTTDGGGFESLTLPEGLELVGRNSFRNEKIKSLGLPTTTKIIDEYAFFDCGIENNLEFTSALKEIKTDAFRGCLFTSVVIPENVVTLAKAFDRNERLTSFVINATELELFGGISGCNNLSNFAINGKVKVISGVASPHITEFVFPEGVTSIGTFANNPYLTKISIPEGVSIIDNYAFENCTALVSVKLPQTVTKIGKNAFLNCASLEEINIPSGLKEIGAYVFEGCTSLTEITVYTGITKANASAFSNSSLETIYFKGTEDQWYDIGFYPSSNYEVVFEQ